jgi:glutaredoxin 3
MASLRQVEVFSAGCPACEEVIQLVRNIACPSCEVTVIDMTDTVVAQRAKSLGIHRVPAVLIDGKLAECCSVSGVSEKSLRAAGLGQDVE